MTEMNRFFFLVIECQKGRICYASSSVESVLGSKPVGDENLLLRFIEFFFISQADLCSQTIFDILYPNDIEVVRQQLINEKKSSSSDVEDSPSDSKSKTCLREF